MIIVPEKEIANLLDRALAFTAVEQVFASMAAGSAYNFPVIRESIGHADALYGFKSGFDRARLNLGLKSGGYWPGNAAKGLTNHQSSIFLFDADSGQCSAVVGGNLITALRTAAAAAVSVAHLSRQNAEVLGIVGAGHQAAFQLRAVAEQRDFKRVVAWNRTASKLDGLRKVADALGLPFESVSQEDLAAQSDVIVTITASFQAVVGNIVKDGCHIACMGTDTAGKQELDPALVARARVFTDEVTQSISIGECQHAVAAGLLAQTDIAELGAVINGEYAGRRSAAEITLFDGTGVGLQDLAVADSVVQRAVATGVAIMVDT